MLVVGAPAHAGTAHSRPMHGPSGVSFGISPPMMGPLPPLPVPAVDAPVPPVAVAPVPGLPSTLLSSPAGEHEKAKAPAHTTAPTTTERRNNAEFIDRFMATPS